MTSAPCSMCRGPRDREGQAYCIRCMREYSRAHRAARKLERAYDVVDAIKPAALAFAARVENLRAMRWCAECKVEERAFGSYCDECMKKRRRRSDAKRRADKAAERVGGADHEFREDNDCRCTLCAGYRRLFGSGDWE